MAMSRDADSTPAPAPHASAVAEAPNGSVPPNPFGVAAAADLPNPFRAAARAGTRRASAPAHVMNQHFGRLHPAGSGRPGSGQMSTEMSIALSDAGPMLRSPPSRQPSEAPGGDGLLAKLQTRLLAVQVARSRENSLPASPRQQPQGRHEQSHQQHDSARQQHGGSSQQQPLDAARQPNPANVAAAIAAAGEQRALEAQGRLFGVPIGSLPQLSLGTQPERNAAAPSAAPKADAVASGGGNGHSDEKSGDDKAVYLQPPPVPREGSGLRVHSGTFRMPAGSLRRLSPPELSALQSSVARNDDSHSPSRVESGRSAARQLNLSRSASGRVESGRQNFARPDGEAGRAAQRNMADPKAAEAAAIAAATAVIAQRQQLTGGPGAARHATPTPDEREATAGLAQLGAKLAVGLPGGQGASHRPSWGSDTSAFHTVGAPASQRHRLGRPGSAEDETTVPAAAPQQRQRQQDASQDVEMVDGSPPGGTHSGSSRSSADGLQRQAATPALAPSNVVMDPAAVQRRPRSVRKHSMVAESAPTPPPPPQLHPREEVADGAGPATAPFQPGAKRARGSVINAAAHARMAAYAAVVYNCNRPAGYPAIAVIPDHAAGLAEEINAVVSGSQKVVAAPGRELLASTARFRAFMNAQREAAEALRSAQGSVAFQAPRSSQSNARGGSGGGGGSGGYGHGYGGVRSDTLRSDLRSGEALRATAAAAVAEEGATAADGAAGAGDGGIVRGSGSAGEDKRGAGDAGAVDGDGGRRSPLGRSHSGPQELLLPAAAKPAAQRRPARSVRIRSQPAPSATGGARSGGSGGRHYGGLAALAEAVAASGGGSPAPPPLAPADAASPDRQRRQQGLLGSLQAAAANLNPEDEPLPGDNIRSLSRQGPPQQGGHSRGDRDGRREGGEVIDEDPGFDNGRAASAKRRRSGPECSESHPVQRHEPRLPPQRQPPAAAAGSAPAGSRMADAEDSCGKAANEAAALFSSPFRAAQQAAAAAASPMEAAP